ncbi:hypothetical protein TNCV_4088501 [Trichonephila clavipes]|nr:hypothetical protein TNCV_4088501 [Trichonephila clavipes]
MFDSSSFVNPTPLAHADASRDVLPRGAIEVLSRPKLTGIVRGKAFLHVLRRRPIGCPDSNAPDNARCDGYDSEQHRLDYFSNDICALRNGCRRK